MYRTTQSKVIPRKVYHEVVRRTRKERKQEVAVAFLSLSPLVSWVIIIVADRLGTPFQGGFHTSGGDKGVHHEKCGQRSHVGVLFPWKMRQEIAETKAAFLFLSLSLFRSLPLGSSYANRRNAAHA